MAAVSWSIWIDGPTHRMRLQHQIRLRNHILEAPPKFLFEVVATAGPPFLVGIRFLIADLILTCFGFSTPAPDCNTLFRVMHHSSF